MKKRLLRNFVAIICLLFLLTPVYQVSAGLLSTVEDGGLKTIGDTAYGQAGAPEDVRVVIANIMKKLMGFIGVIMVVLVVYSGFQWMTAGGEKTKVEEAKKRLQNAVIGLIIIFSAYIFTNFILSCVINAVNQSGGFIWGGICG